MSLCDTPEVRLPLTVKIVTHPQEKRTKCTGVQAVLLAPGNAQLLDYAEVQQEDCLELGTAAVLFPTAGAATPEHLDLRKITTLYVVDRCGKHERSLMRSSYHVFIDTWIGNATRTRLLGTSVSHHRTG